MKLLKKVFKTTLVVIASLALTWLLYNWLSYSRFSTDNLPQTASIANGNYTNQISKARDYLTNIPSKINTPSFSVAVGHKGEVIWSEAIGYQDIKSQTPATSETQYRIGSTSKAVSSTLAARLYEQGLINLDKDLNGVISGYPVKQWGFTPKQLLSHTAGLPDYGDLNTRGIYRTLCNCKQYENVQEGLSVFSDVPLLFEPGTDYQYNSFDIVLMSAYMEQATGTPFLSLLQNEVFAPAQMKSSLGDHSPSTPANAAMFYEIRGHKYRKWRSFGFLPAEINLSYKWAGGGLLSTPSDLVKMGNSLLTDTSFVSKSTLDTFWEPQKLTNGEVNPQRYALGWRSYSDYEHKAFEEPVWIVHHGGVSKGSMNLLLLFPDHDLAINASINTKAEEFDLLWNEVMTLASFFLE